VTVLLAALLWPSRKADRHRTVAEQVAARPTGSFPVPPIDLQVPPSPRAKRVVAERLAANEAQRQPANVGAGTDTDTEPEEKED
jgi:NADH-quinone oxidoreductase subunit H